MRLFYQTNGAFQPASRQAELGQDLSRALHPDWNVPQWRNPAPKTLVSFQTLNIGAFPSYPLFAGLSVRKAQTDPLFLEDFEMLLLQENFSRKPEITLRVRNCDIASDGNGDERNRVGLAAMSADAEGGERMRTLKLYFEAGQLTEVAFRENANSEPRRTIRGKTGGAFRHAGSFQWTSAGRALGRLLAKAGMNPQNSTIQGLGGTLASSLDYALSKQPVWISEMFGCDQHGISYARRLILRTNPERKRPGPVVLGVNYVYLPATSIEVFVDGTRCSGSDLGQLVASLEGTPFATPWEVVHAPIDSRLASNM